MPMELPNTKRRRGGQKAPTSALGSVAENVARHAQCLAEIVRVPNQAISIAKPAIAGC